GPEPSSCLPASLTSIPGASVAWVTSMTMAASGSRAKALVREPPQGVSSWAGAPTPSPPRRPPARGHEPCRLEGHEGPEAVVQGARCQPPVGQLQRLGVDHRHVPDSHHLARLLAVAGADVDVHLAQARKLLALLLAQEVDGLLAEHAAHGTAGGVDDETLAHEDLRV